MSPRDAIHDLVDKLPKSELKTAQRYLEYLYDKGDPFMEMLNNAPYDDEPTTPEEDASCKEAMEEYRRGEAIPLKDLKRELDM